VISRIIAGRVELEKGMIIVVKRSLTGSGSWRGDRVDLVWGRLRNII